MGVEAVVIGGVIGGIAASKRHGGGGGGGNNSAEIQRIQAENARKKKERQDKLKQQEERQKAEEKKLKEENKKLQKKLEEEKEKIRKEKELADKNRKEEELEKERQKQQKIKNANEFYLKEKKIYETKKLNEIKDNFIKNNFCLNQSNKLKTYVKEKIPKIFSKLDSKIKEKVKENFSEILGNIKNANSTRKKRILLIGKTGVGKSTLINAIFGFDLAETGFGRPITMNEKPKKYEYNTQADLELYDSRGIEIDPNYGVEVNYNKIKNFIEEQFQKKEPLDAIWYCITGTKMEEVEFELIKKLKALYTDNSLTSIIVYTQSFFEEDFIEMKNYLITKIDKELIIQNVLAKMKKMGNSFIKSFGLEELLSQTKSLIDKNSNLVLLSASKTNTEKKMEDLLEEKIIISNEMNFNVIFDKIISSYLGNNTINQEIKNLIQEFYSSYDIKCNSIIDENLKTIIDKESQIMNNDLKNLVTTVLLKFDNVISIDQKGFLEESKKKISKLLLNIAKEYGKNNLNSGVKKIIENEIKNYLRKKNKEYISSI